MDNSNLYPGNNLNTGSEADWIKIRNHFPVVEKYIYFNRSLRDQLTEAGYLVLSSEYTEESSGVLSFKHPMIQTELIYRNLFEAEVVCAIRGGAVRISPHFYNNEVDINGFVKALPN